MQNAVLVSKFVLINLSFKLYKFIISYKPINFMNFCLNFKIFMLQCAVFK